MSEIDWNKLAEDYELTVDEFRYQMFVSVAAMGAMDMEVLDKPEMAFTCADSEGPIYLTVAREKKELSNAEKERIESEILAERDYWGAKATELAIDVGKALGVNVGEHSNVNCPVQNAIDALYGLTHNIEGIR